jgi:hypothetical protein
MLTGWLDARPAVEFAESIAREIEATIPPGDQLAKVRKDKRAKRLERVIEKTRAFGKTHRLNFYKKARFANKLKWSLSEAGYPDEFVRDLVGLVITTL